MRSPYSKGLFREGVLVAGVGMVSPENFDAKALIGGLPRFRKMDRFSQYAVGAARLALRDANLALPVDAGAVIASRFGAFNSTDKFLKGIAEHGAHLASAIVFPNTVMNMAAGMLSIGFGIKGPTITIAGELDQAMNLAADLIQHGRANIVVAGYVEEINDRFSTGMDGAVIYVLENTP